MSNKKIEWKAGFTLIELLTVIGIIGLMFAFIISFIDPAMQLKKGRDGVRKSDLRQIQAALEMYRADLGTYPDQAAANVYKLNTTDCPTSNALTVGSSNYLGKIPCDPKGTGIVYNGGNYYYAKSGATYTLAACLENSKDGETTVPNPPPSPATCNSGRFYILKNP